MYSRSHNPAAAQGWVKSTDPKTGRVFYANHITRKTQWEAPSQWVDEVTVPSSSSSSSDGGVISSRDDVLYPDDFDHHNNKNREEEPLPSNWEVMHDPTSGKPFYVDHERKITTWTRPKKESVSSSLTSSQGGAASMFKPAIATPPSSSNASASLARLLRVQEACGVSSASTSSSSKQSTSRSYEQEASYLTFSGVGSSATDVDFSDALPKLDFAMQKVADALRPTCASCGITFTMKVRRHHCRLCGDVFCDACSNHRVQLPLEGAEFAKPVRVCDYCMKDVDAGNFFSLRRYLTPLHLYNYNSETDKSSISSSIKTTDTTASGGVATPQSVNAALCSLRQDLNQWIQTGDTSLDKISIPPDRFIAAIVKHLTGSPETTNYAMCALASLLAMESMAGSHEMAKQTWTDQDTPEGIIKILERSGTDRKTLFVQEQAARTWFYLTEAKTIQDASSLESAVSVIESFDLGRAVRCFLDHASSGGKNPNLQRWSAACIAHCIAEDQRRACLALNDVASAVAGGEAPPKLAYESFLTEVTSSGGIMMLTSLITTDDADTRAQAVAALATALLSTRAVDASRIALAEITGQTPGKCQDGDIVRAIIAGGCASSVARLLLSADHAIAEMGCQFLASLVMPLLADPLASASLPSDYDCRYDQDGLGACREAALEIATESCFPALLSLIRENGKMSRPIELRKVAMETLAAISLAVGEMGKAWAKGHYEEGLERSGTPAKLKDAICIMNEEGAVSCALEVLQSSSGQSLGSSRETSASRIRETAGIVLSSLTSCSAEAIIDLQTKQIVSSLLLSSSDPSISVQSTLRGDAAPRCLGVLETVSSILMFAWQHPSGASSDLLDQLIEMIDSGAVPYLSRVINSKMDWESKDKSVGAMKARIASCKILCCLFGIALNDETGIGMRRLMDAVDSDSHSYRGNERAPRNLIESTLAVLQTASGFARQVLLGSLSHGPHYQTTLMDLVDASLLAAGSMCGSSIAPGGSEGTMVSGENFLCVRKDPYVTKRTSICRVACDVVVRGGGRAGPALLPTMFVGGFGENAVLSSLRLALAIAQNGSKDEHAKLANSGILVPISDSLRSALSKGDLYGFSASLAMVRFCGPYVAAGHGGGIESVRDAIRIACNVLTLTINPEASIKQMETQDSLKSECISALESLSQNASLWSSISSEALPAMVQYLHATSALKSSANSKRQATLGQTLKAVRQIVQVPSHAVSAAEAGIVEPLGKLLRSSHSSDHEKPVPMLVLEVLHVVVSNVEARRKGTLLHLGLARSIAFSLGTAATLQPNKTNDNRADITFLGLEILLGILSDIESESNTAMMLQSQDASCLLDSIASEEGFVRCLCATLLVSTNMQLPRHDAEQSGESSFVISQLYGPPLILVPEKCAGFSSTHDAAASFLFRSSALACAIESVSSDKFWKSVLLQNANECHDPFECSRVSATLCAHYLSLINNDHEPFVPREHQKKQEYLTITRPLVRYRLLESLKDLIEDMSSQLTYGSDPYVTSILVSFNVPHICLSLWKDPAILDLAFALIKQIMIQDSDEVLHLFVASKSAIMSLFGLLNLDASFEASKNVGEIRRFLASVIGQLAESGLLANAIEKFDIRSSAIEALAVACISEEERPPDEDEDMTSNRLATILMRCLVDLCSVMDYEVSEKKQIVLSPQESTALANSLGTKICHMVLSRFLERAKLQQYELEDVEDNIMDAPDVSLLCAIAQHEQSLSTLRSIGGLHALSLVAAEGELSAMVALKKACGTDASVLLEGDTFIALMTLLTEDSDSKSRRELKPSAFELLSRLCTSSATACQALSGVDSCRNCIIEAIHIVMTAAGLNAEMLDGSTTDDEPLNDGLADSSEDGDNERPPAYSQLQPHILKPSLNVNDNIELGVAACLFMASLAPTSIYRDTLGENERCIAALAAIVESSDYASLRFAALQVLVSLGPYAGDERVFPSEFLASVLLKVFSSDLKVPTTAELNLNLMHVTAVNGFNIIVDYISEEMQEALSVLLASLFKKSVKACSVLRSNAKEIERAYAPSLLFSLSTALVHVKGKTFADRIVINQDLVVSLIHLIQWRWDLKTSISSEDARLYDAATSNCLLLLSMLVWRPEPSLEASGINLKALSDTTLMLARPGKAPRKAIDFKSALERVAEGTDSAATQSAVRILRKLNSL